jgi:hypothetical protein
MKRSEAFARRCSMRIKLVLIMIAALSLMVSPVLALSVGDKAPGFTAQTNQGEVSLADYLGEKNVILTFYFAIYTPA